MRKPCLVLIAVLACAPWGPLSAQAFLEDSPQFTSARLAMGGVHVALADDITTLLFEPGGFSIGRPAILVFGGIRPSCGPVFALANLFSKVPGSSNPAAL